MSDVNESKSILNYGDNDKNNKRFYLDYYGYMAIIKCYLVFS